MSWVASGAWGRFTKVAAGLLAGVAVATSAAFAGSSTTSRVAPSVANASGITEAKAIVAKSVKPITKGPPGPAFDASSASGKKVWFVSFALSIAYSQQVWKGVQMAADALGMEAKSFDGKFSATETARGIELAIQDKADAIVVHSLPPSVVAPALAKADAAGVKLISAETQNPGPPLPDVPKTIDAIAGHSYSIPTTIMAAKIVADSGGKANVLFLSVNDIGPGSKQGTATFVAKMKQLCPTCKVKVMDTPVAQWSGLTTRIQSLLRSNPDVNYVAPIFDGMAVYIVPGISAMGAGDKVKLVSGDATPSVLENLKRGNVVIGDVGQPNVWTGMAIIDQTARVLAGVKPLQNVGIRYRLFDSSNVKGLNLKTNDPTPWYGNVDFLAAYKTLWGVQ